MKKSGYLLFLFGLLIAPLLVQAQLPISGAYIGRFTTQERTDEAGNSEQHMRLYNRLVLRYEPSETFAFRMAVRRADYFQENVGNNDIYYGYVNWKPISDLDLTVGRQYPYNKMIRHAIDGVSAEWSFYPGLTLAGMYGAFAPADRGWIHPQWDENHGSYLALQYSGNESLKGRLAIFQEVTEGRIQNYVAVDGSVPDLYGFRLSGLLKYNFTNSLVQEANALVRKEAGEKLVVAGEFNYRDPSFDLPEWYWQFNIDPYSTLRLSMEFWVTNTASFTTEFFSRYMTDGAVQRYRAGWLALNWSFGVVHASNDDSGSSETTIYGSFQHRFGSKLLIGAGVNYFDYIYNETYEDPLNAYGVQVFTRYRINKSLSAGIRGYYLTNPEFSKDVRVLGELGYQF